MTTPQLRQIIDDWIAVANNGDWNGVLRLLHERVTYNGDELTADELARRLNELYQAPSGRTIDRNMFIANEAGDEVAVRFLLAGDRVDGVDDDGVQEDATTATASTAIGQALLFFSCKDGKIADITSLHDPLAFRSHQPEQEKHLSTPRIGGTGEAHDGVDYKNASTIAQAYRDYIHSINTNTMSSYFGSFCQPTVTHNARAFSVDEYRTYIEASFDVIQGLHFTIEKLIVDEQEQMIAARLGFTGRPVKEFAGIPPAAPPKNVRFSEHAFYQLSQGKIVRVWSVLDLDAYRACLAA